MGGKNEPKHNCSIECLSNNCSLLGSSSFSWYSKMTKIPIGSKWKHKNSNDVYVVMEQYSHRVMLQHELTGTSIKLTVGHLNPDGFDDYERIEE
jgi:hypothetical protein